VNRYLPCVEIQLPRRVTFDARTPALRDRGVSIELKRAEMIDWLKALEIRKARERREREQSNVRRIGDAR
jgi:hypothetical protein